MKGIITSLAGFSVGLAAGIASRRLVYSCLLYMALYRPVAWAGSLVEKRGLRCEALDGQAVGLMALFAILVVWTIVLFWPERG